MSPNVMLLVAIAAAVYVVTTTIAAVCLYRKHGKTNQELAQQKKALQDLKDSLDGDAVDDIIRYCDEAARHKQEVSDILEQMEILAKKVEDLVRRAQSRLAELEDSAIIRLLDKANALLARANEALSRLDSRVENNAKRIQELKSDVDSLQREDRLSDLKDSEQDGKLAKLEKVVGLEKQK